MGVFEWFIDRVNHGRVLRVLLTGPGLGNKFDAQTRMKVTGADYCDLVIISERKETQPFFHSPCLRKI